MSRFFTSVFFRRSIPPINCSQFPHCVQMFYAFIAANCKTILPVNVCRRRSSKPIWGGKYIHNSRHFICIKQWGCSVHEQFELNSLLIFSAFVFERNKLPENDISLWWVVNDRLKTYSIIIVSPLESIRTSRYSKMDCTFWAMTEKREKCIHSTYWKCQKSTCRIYLWHAKYWSRKNQTKSKYYFFIELVCFGLKNAIEHFMTVDKKIISTNKTGKKSTSQFSQFSHFCNI